MSNKDYYSKQWSSRNPGHLLFLVDQSYSMREAYGEDGSKAEFTANVLNRTIQEAVNMCQDGESLKNRLKISVIGYGGKGGDSVEVMCDDFISGYANNPLRIKKTRQKIVDGDLRLTEIEVNQPVFFEPKAKGSTAMGLAFQTALQLIEGFRSEYPDSPVPMLINVSDGAPWSHERKFQERDLAYAMAQKIMSITTPDGNPLIFNAHIGSGYPRYVCPSDASVLNGRQENFLYSISSEIPERLMSVARKFDLILEEHARGFVSNASPDVFINFINFGSSIGLTRDRMSA